MLLSGLRSGQAGRPYQNFGRCALDFLFTTFSFVRSRQKCGERYGALEGTWNKVLKCIKVN